MWSDIVLAGVVFVLWKLGVIDVQWYVPKWLSESTPEL